MPFAFASYRHMIRWPNPLYLYSAIRTVLAELEWTELFYILVLHTYAVSF